MRSLCRAIGSDLGVPGTDNSGAEIAQRHVPQARNDESIKQTPIQGVRARLRSVSARWWLSPDLPHRAAHARVDSVRHLHDRGLRRADRADDYRLEGHERAAGRRSGKARRRACQSRGPGGASAALRRWRGRGRRIRAPTTSSPRPTPTATSPAAWRAIPTRSHDCPSAGAMSGEQRTAGVHG